ncbi:hypothetical protein ENBRE01_0584 [Enteropsectra breve]|nr:hypothetical protein ENBRE01_0584 [Enteropsectra breve]
MNRRNRGEAKKIEFAPNVEAALQAKPSATEETGETANELNDMPEEGQAMKGQNAPKQFGETKEFNIEKHNFVMSLPASMTNSSLVLFDDGSLGIRANGTIYECDSSFLGSSMVVAVDERVHRINDASFILTGYEFEKDLNSPSAAE